MTGRVSREGSAVPAADLLQLLDGVLQRISTKELLGKGRSVVFALPGAFTPTCSTAHVPGYIARLGDFGECGVDRVICLSVNDPYVMEAWQRAENAQGLTFAADPDGDFTRAMGMLVDKRADGLGQRSWRYSMLVEDGQIRKMFVEPDEPGDPFEVSDADTMLDHLQPNRQKIGPILMLARHGCPYCARAKAMLNERKLPFEAVHVGTELTMQGVLAASGTATVPQVFVNGKLIGGSEQLEKYLASIKAPARA